MGPCHKVSLLNAVNIAPQALIPARVASAGSQFHILTPTFRRMSEPHKCQKPQRAIPPPTISPATSRPVASSLSFGATAFLTSGICPKPHPAIPKPPVVRLPAEHEPDRMFVREAVKSSRRAPSGGSAEDAWEVSIDRFSLNPRSQALPGNASLRGSASKMSERHPFLGPRARRSLAARVPRQSLGTRGEQAQTPPPAPPSMYGVTPQNRFISAVLARRMTRSPSGSAAHGADHQVAGRVLGG